MNVRLFVALCHNLQWAVIQIPVAEEWMVLFRSSRGTRHAFTPSTPQYGRWTTPRTASSRGQAQPRGGHSQIPKQLLPAGQEEASSRGQNRPHKPRTRHLQKKTPLSRLALGQGTPLPRGVRSSPSLQPSASCTPNTEQTSQVLHLLSAFVSQITRTLGWMSSNFRPDLVFEKF